MPLGISQVAQLCRLALAQLCSSEMAAFTIELRVAGGDPRSHFKKVAKSRRGELAP